MTSHFSLWSTILFLLNWGIIIGALVVIPFRRSPAAAQGWLLLFFFQPFAATILYFFIGDARHPKWRRERIKDVPSVVLKAIGEIPSAAEAALTLGPRSRTAAHLVQTLGQLPCLSGNSIDLDPNYNRVVDRITADIDSATHHAHAMFYILHDDEAGNKVLSALERAARRGVKCRLLIDAVGSSYHRDAIARRLDGSGVEIRLILPLRFWRRATRADLRNHRKIVVVDGRTGWVGSQNMHQIEYEPNTFYREVMARVTGPVVLELQAIFIGDWFLETDEDISAPELMPMPATTEGGVVAQVMPSGPDHPAGRLDTLFTDLIHSARERVVLTTPYFIPNEPLSLALQSAVQKGVKVTLFVTATTNSFLIDHAQRSYYDELLESGVEVMLYRERFLHAKHLSIDDDIAVIGSANMDRRSFELNSEVTLLAYDAGVVKQMRRIENDYRAKSARLMPDDWDQRGFFTKLTENATRLISPLL
ncbi:cardiolipin synthase [Aureimonas glaciei]|jgi:cardiolipin synthase|uniref:Cardiolipin synthase n=1 Tax=Aureimonas glaciei TaxID=1776957 RepID=A0A917D9H1_9HYPH|nr:cardiolipin synthase [Aureimonas glaciei]GGD18389.1 cardiolipin synthase A [Aureimonas glaciei]